MPAFLAPAAAWIGKNALGLLAAGGGMLQNRGARASADKAMAFSERMSSTAAQRSVEDYRRAGLNPALAYDRPASSPGGSVAPVEDVIGRGISSGLAARQAQASIDLTNAQKEKVNTEAELLSHDLSLRQTTVEGEPSWRDAQIAERVARLRDIAHQGRLQPNDERLRALAVALAKAQNQGAQFRGGMFEDATAVKDFIKAGLSSGRDAAEAFRAWMSAAPSVGKNIAGRAKKAINRNQPRR